MGIRLNNISTHPFLAFATQDWTMAALLLVALVVWGFMRNWRKPRVK
jgi:hypothetical protein